jgi:hypothetical protein
MKKLDRQFFQSILIVILSLAIFLILVAGYLKIDEYRRLSYNVNTKFLNTDVIKLTNKLPISDEIGKSYTGKGMEDGIEGYSEFTIHNPNDKKVDFEIYVTKMDLEVDEIKSNYIKFYLTDEKNNPVNGFEQNKIKSYSDLYALSDKPGSRLVYRGSLVAGSTKKYILRSWVADTYILSKDLEGFNYDIDVRIK